MTRRGPLSFADFKGKTIKSVKPPPPPSEGPSTGKNAPSDAPSDAPSAFPAPTRQERMQTDTPSESGPGGRADDGEESAPKRKLMQNYSMAGGSQLEQLEQQQQVEQQEQQGIEDRPTEKVLTEPAKPDGETPGSLLAVPDSDCRQLATLPSPNVRLLGQTLGCQTPLHPVAALLAKHAAFLAAPPEAELSCAREVLAELKAALDPSNGDPPRYMCALHPGMSSVCCATACCATVASFFAVYLVARGVLRPEATGLKFDLARTVGKAAGAAAAADAVAGAVARRRTNCRALTEAKKSSVHSGGTTAAVPGSETRVTEIENLQTAIANAVAKNSSRMPGIALRLAQALLADVDAAGLSSQRLDLLGVACGAVCEKLLEKRLADGPPIKAALMVLYGELKQLALELEHGCCAATGGLGGGGRLKDLWLAYHRVDRFVYGLADAALENLQNADRENAAVDLDCALALLRRQQQRFVDFHQAVMALEGGGSTFVRQEAADGRALAVRGILVSAVRACMQQIVEELTRTAVLFEEHLPRSHAPFKGRYANFGSGISGAKTLPLRTAQSSGIAAR